MSLEFARPSRYPVARGIQQQSRRLDRVAGDDDRFRFLEMLAPFAIEITHAGDAIVFPEMDSIRHGSARTSAPLRTASGTCVMSVLAFAPTLQP